MKNIKDIFNRDMNTIIHNWAALIIVIGLCFIPALYAWVNIAANWDPYSNTKNIPVAVVNEDIGAVIAGKRLNIGDDIVAGIAENDSIGWDLVDEYQAEYGLQQGKYYAIIEIPATFSSNLASYLTTTPQKPEIIYKANEKANAIATKITDVAKTKLTESIKEEIISTVNSELMEQLNAYGEELADNKTEILAAVALISESQSRIEQIDQQLNDEVNTINQTQASLQAANDDVYDLNDDIDDLKAANLSMQAIIVNTNDDIIDLASQIKTNSQVIKTNSQKTNQSLDDLADLITSEENQATISELLNNVIVESEDLSQVLDSISTEVSSLALADDKKETINDLITLTQSEVTRYNAALKVLKAEIDSNEASDKIVAQITNIQNLNTATTNGIINTYDNFYDVIVPILNLTTNTLLTDANQVNTYLDAAQSLQPQVLAINNFAISMGNVHKSEINTIISGLNDSSEKLTKINEISQVVDEDFLDQAIDLMEKDPEVVGNFLASPINVEEVDIYGDRPFGVGLTPFYTTLGIWVGVLLMSALLSMEIEPFQDHRLVKTNELHFGKLLLFLSVAIIQTTIVSVGDILILKVYPEDILLFFVISYVCCLVFTIMIYTLVSLFGNVGKAIAVVIMVFQIAGSGGIYPIQTNPAIFGILQPLWPFTYAIDCFRQAIAGPEKMQTLYDLRCLALFFLVYFVLGFLKKYFYNMTMWVETRFKKAEL